MKKNAVATVYDKNTAPAPAKKPMALLCAEDALEAARLTGYKYESVRRTDWGLIVDGQFPFCFRFVDDALEMGIPGILTPNAAKVVDFLRWRGYDIDRLQGL